MAGADVEIPEATPAATLGAKEAETTPFQKRSQCIKRVVSAAQVEDIGRSSAGAVAVCEQKLCCLCVKCCTRN